MLLRAANRVENKTWKERLERQDNLLTCKRKDTSTGAWTHGRNGRIYLNTREESEEKINKVQEEEQNPFKPASWYYAGNPLFYTMLWKGFACVVLDRAASLWSIIEVHVKVISVNQCFIYVVSRINIHPTTTTHSSNWTRGAERPEVLVSLNFNYRISFMTLMNCVIECVLLQGCKYKN